MLKNFKPTNLAFHDMKRFDSSINSSRVVIEHVFGALKNQWRILKSFSLNVDKCANVKVTCFVLHNFNKLHWVGQLPQKWLEHLDDPFVGMHCRPQVMPNYENGGKIAE